MSPPDDKDAQESRGLGILGEKIAALEARLTERLGTLDTNLQRELDRRREDIKTLYNRVEVQDKEIVRLQGQLRMRTLMQALGTLLGSGIAAVLGMKK